MQIFDKLATLLTVHFTYRENIADLKKSRFKKNFLIAKENFVRKPAFCRVRVSTLDLPQTLEFFSRNHPTLEVTHFIDQQKATDYFIRPHFRLEFQIPAKTAHDPNLCSMTIFENNCRKKY